MFDAADCVFFYLESPLHVGSGEETAQVDQPVQREPATRYPFLPASSLKGALRGRARAQRAPDEMIRLLGADPHSETPQPSCVAVSDGLPLAFPVRSLAGLFAWVSSLEVWARLERDVAAYGAKLASRPALPPPAEAAGVAPGSPLLTRQSTLVLEELSFPVQPSEAVAQLGAWMGEHVLPDQEVFAYWRQRLAHSLVLLPEWAYRYFLEHSTQIVPRIRIDPRKGTVVEGSLWTEEYLPPETVMYALVGTRAPQPDSAVKGAETPEKSLAWVKGLAPTYLQLGGGQTLGRGIVRLRWAGKAPTRPATRRKTKKS